MLHDARHAVAQAKGHARVEIPPRLHLDRAVTVDDSPDRHSSGRALMATMLTCIRLRTQARPKPPRRSADSALAVRGASISEPSKQDLHHSRCVTAGIPRMCFGSVHRALSNSRGVAHGKGRSYTLQERNGLTFRGPGCGGNHSVTRRRKRKP